MKLGIFIFLILLSCIYEKEILQIGTVHFNKISEYKISHNHKLIATIPEIESDKSVLDHTIKIWDRKGKLVYDFIGHESTIKDFIFLKDGKTFVSFDRSLNLIVWDLETGKIRNKKDFGFIKNIFEVSETEFGAVTYDIFDVNMNSSSLIPIVIYICNSKGEIIYELKDKMTKDQIVYSIFSHKNNIISVFVEPIKIRIWNKNGILLNSVNGEKYKPDDICIENEEIKVIEKNKVHLFNFQGIYITSKEKDMKDCLEHSKDISETCNFDSPLKDKYLVVSDINNGFKICDRELKKEIQVSKDSYPYSLPINIIKFDGNNNIISAEGNRLIRWNLEAMNSKIFIDEDSYRINDFDFYQTAFYYVSQDKISANQSTSSSLWKIDLNFEEKIKKSKLLSIEDGYLKLSSSNNNENLIFSYQKNNSQVIFYKYYPSGIELMPFKEKQSSSVSTNKLMTSNFISDNSIYFGAGKTIKIFNNLSSKDLINSAHTDDIKIICQDDLDENIIYTASYDKYIKKWNLKSCMNVDCSPEYELSLPHHISVFKSVDSQLYIGTDSGMLYLIDTNGNIKFQFKAHDLKITSILVNKNLLFTSSLDKKIKILDLNNQFKIISELQSIYYKDLISYIVKKEDTYYVGDKNIFDNIRILDSNTKFKINFNKVKLWY